MAGLDGSIQGQFALDVQGLDRLKHSAAMSHTGSSQIWGYTSPRNKKAKARSDKVSRDKGRLS